MYVRVLYILIIISYLVLLAIYFLGSIVIFYRAVFEDIIFIVKRLN